MPSLPEISGVELEVIADRSAEREGFLTLRRFDLAILRDGHRGPVFRYDLVERRALDAAVMAAHHRDGGGRPYVYLRSSLRPPIALRDGRSAVLWELPAGLIDPGEEPRGAAARELEEELGFTVTAEAMQPLGAWAYPAPAFIAEVHHFFHVEVDPAARREPGGDGSAVEEGAIVVSIPLDEAIAACDTGVIRDEKTELALRRLAGILS